MVSEGARWNVCPKQDRPVVINYNHYSSVFMVASDATMGNFPVMEWNERQVECSSTSTSESCLGIAQPPVVGRLSVEMPLYELAFFYYIGIFTSLFFLWWFINEVFKGFRLFIWSRIRPTKNLTTRYGKWAVVTGSTDGIGKGYALELARRGLNICLISRNESKLINVANEIKSQHHVSVKWIVADFRRVDIYDYIEKELSALDDIGILVNNVGVAPDKWEIFCNQDKNFSLSTININITSCVIMTQIILKKFIPQERGLIINVGSMSSVIPLPYGAVYSSTKVFIDNFTLCLRAELAGTNIEVQCLRPFFVQTNLIAHMTTLKEFHKKFLPFIFPRAEDFTRSAVTTINGHVPLYTCGYWPMSLTRVLLPVDFLSRTTRGEIARFSMKYFWGAITKPKFKSNNNC